MNEVRAMRTKPLRPSFRPLSARPGGCPPAGRACLRGLSGARGEPKRLHVREAFRNKATPGTGTLRKTETRRFPRRVSLPGTERFAFEHICRPDPVFRLAGFTLPPEQPQVNCGDTGEGELRDAPGRQREARYGQGERRGISPCPAPWSTS